MTTTQTTWTGSLTIAQRIIRAYRVLTAGTRTWIYISDLRDLMDYSDAEVDAVLRQLSLRCDCHLAPEANQKVLTAEQRAGAVRFGGKDQHLILIEPGFQL